MTDFEKNLRQQLRAKEVQLEQENIDNLRIVRQKAVAKNRGFRLPRVLLPLGGMTMASIAIFFLVLSPMQQTVDPTTDSLAVDSSEMQDLDFYYWLAENQDVSEI